MVWLYLRYDDYPSFKQAAFVTAVKVVDLAIVIYLVNMVLVPRFLYTKSYLLFAVAFIGI